MSSWARVSLSLDAFCKHWLFSWGFWSTMWPRTSSSFLPFWQYDGDFIARVAKEAVDSAPTRSWYANSFLSFLIWHASSSVWVSQIPSMTNCVGSKYAINNVIEVSDFFYADGLLSMTRMKMSWLLNYGQNDTGHYVSSRIVWNMSWKRVRKIQRKRISFWKNFKEKRTPGEKPGQEKGETF